MIDQQEASRRRRIVHQALKAHVSPASLQTAVKLIDKEFQSEAVFSVQRFLDRLAQLDSEVATQKGVLFKTLMTTRAIDPKQLGPDPLASSSSAPPPTKTMASPSSSSISVPSSSAKRSEVTTGWPGVFQKFIKSLIDQIRNQAENRLSNLVLQLTTELPALKLSLNATRDIRVWVSTRFAETLHAENMSLTEMQAFLHTIYIWCCEEFGPVATDRLFGRVLKETETHPDATNHPPQAFL